MITIKKTIYQLVAYLFSKIFSILKYESFQLWTRDEIAQVNFTFSQFGEDILIAHYLEKFSPADGIYVDIGAFDPIKYSNTLLLYKQGWQGINIDIDRDKVEALTAQRSRDYSVSAAISDRKEKVQFITYPCRPTNRLLPIDSTDYRSVLGEDPLEVTTLETTQLEEVIATSPFADRDIYYLNIDCEGNDLNVLKSCNLERNLPKLITIEAWSEPELKEIEDYLLPKGYVLASSVHITKFFTHSAQNAI
jgi:FkbM family methyltransferase